MTTKINIALRGVVMDGVMAVAESAVRVVEEEEREGLGEGIEVEVGGKRQRVESETEVERLKEKLKQEELRIGPGGTGALNTDGEDATSEMATGEEKITAASSWTEGAKTVLIIRVDFSDAPGEPVDAGGTALTAARALNLINTEVNTFYKNNSYNKTSMTGTVTSVLRMPQTAAYYGGQDPSKLLADARAAALAANYPNTHNLDIVAFKRIPAFTWAGLGYIGGKGTWLNGYFSFREAGHEVGHNYGLYHANLWKTTNGTAVGTGTSQEYGDPFDTMGAGNTTIANHFNSWFKNRLNWLTDASAPIITAPGTYRIEAYDSATATGRLALRIQRDAATYYWIDFRQQLVSSASAYNGAMIHWGYTTNKQSNLLDMTPATVGSDDEALPIGQTFTDPTNGIQIKAVAKVGTALDVSISFGSLTAVSLSTPSIGGGGTVTGTVTLSSPAPVGGTTVALSDNIAATTVPVNVVVPAGLKTKTFSITTIPVTINQTGSVTASYGGMIKTAPLTVAPIALNAVSVSPASVAGGVNVTGTATLNGPAPAAGVVVTLSDTLAATTVPASVTIPSGKSSATFTITTVMVGASQSGTLSAKYGAITKTAALTVRPAALLSVTLNPASVAGGNNVTGTATLDGPALAGGAVVTLSDNLTTATTPASVTIAANARSATFTITTSVVAAKQVGTVTASRGGVTKTAALTVRLPSVQSIVVSPNPIPGGSTATGTITLDRLSTSSTVVTLSDTLAATTIPTSITIPANTLSQTFTVTTTVAIPSQLGTISASANGETRMISLRVVSTVSQLLLNPGFELGAVSWLTNNPNKNFDNSGGGRAHSGVWDGWLAGYTGAATDYLYQDVTIPATATSANLNFYIWQPTDETTTTLANDTLKLQIQNTSGVVLANLATYSNLTKTTGFVKKTFNLLPYKGQRVRVYFASSQNATLTSWFFLDDITLDVIQ
jgi:hypothetical protein